jgi:hypothetical protein
MAESTEGYVLESLPVALQWQVHHACSSHIWDAAIPYGFTHEQNRLVQAAGWVHAWYMCTVHRSKPQRDVQHLASAAAPLLVDACLACSSLDVLRPSTNSTPILILTSALLAACMQVQGRFPSQLMSEEVQ